MLRSPGRSFDPEFKLVAASSGSYSEPGPAVGHSMVSVEDLSRFIGRSLEQFVGSKYIRTALTRRRLPRARVVVVATVCAAMVATGLGTVPTASGAAHIVGAGFTVTPSDLAFILRQTKIAEAHVANTTSVTGPCGALLGTGPNQIPSPLLSFGLRTVDGSCNNLVPGRELFGAAYRTFPRLTTPEYRPAEVGTSYEQTTGSVIDSRPRQISNLIVDQTALNPAAVAAAGAPRRSQVGSGGVAPCIPPATPPGCVAAGDTLFIPNVTTDIGLSPPFNTLFLFFGQFFDHGLDKITNGGSGTVVVPINGADDPADSLAPGSLTVTRGRNQPGPDGIVGDPNPALPDTSLDDVQNATNTVSPFVDQSQTYSSHPSHQVFLREYEMRASRPFSTGLMLASTDGGMATWAQVKTQALNMLGLRLVDMDVHNIPKIAADPYGKFIPGPLRGLPQYETATGLVEGNLDVPVMIPANAIRIDTAFLNDIAHSANPRPAPGTTTVAPDTDEVAGNSLDTPICPEFITGCYDNELLDLHIIAGDGRANENIALVAVHQIFHSEHNRLVADIKNTLLTDDSVQTSLADWQITPGVWNGERLFQAARFVNEMEYQHLAFEEFARKVQPAINPFAVEAFTQANLDPAIVAEFAHAAFRFGHSMASETIARTNADGSPNDIPLLEAFMNPVAYTDGGLTSKARAGGLVMGMSDQTGSEIDEFVTDVLRNRLLGRPLDLPTINMTRGRSEGIPSLNNVRRQLFAQTNDGQLTPYSSWTVFGQALRNPGSLVNFVAAYGQHPNIVDATTTAAKRSAARSIVSVVDVDTPLDAAAFMTSTGATWANLGDVSRTGLDDVDLWMGGLAENSVAFGGLLGPTFNYVFTFQLNALQDSDRFYYLGRLPGMNLSSQIEGNSFSELVMRNTEGTHTLKADPFATADCKFGLAPLTGTAAGFISFGEAVANVGSTECNENLLLIRDPDGTIRYRATNTVDPPGINGQSVYNGTPEIDRIYGGNDNDTFWGGLGDDIINGGGGDDVPLGGEGNDIISDFAGDDILKGGPGNDAIDGGPGLDIILGGEGNDFTNGGAGFNETHGSAGNDFAIAGEGADEVFGDSGDDWIEGGLQPDSLVGDSGSLMFADNNVPGNDILIGQAGDDAYTMEGGDDIGVVGPGVERTAGAAGYDWAIGLGDLVPQDFDLEELLIRHPVGAPALQDRFAEVEALSGAQFDDILRGDNLVPANVVGGGILGNIGCNALDQAGLNRIAGLDALVPPLTTPSGPIIAASVTKNCLLVGNVWGAGNIILGGGGSDLIEGRGGDDIIDGDRYLSVRLSVRTNPADPGTETGTTDLMSATATIGEFGPPGSDMTLQQAVFAGLVDPGNIVAVREVLPLGANPDVDTALFTGSRIDYTITPGPNGMQTVTDNVLGGDGSDTLYNIEELRFAGASRPVLVPLTGTSPAIGAAPVGAFSVSLTAPSAPKLGALLRGKKVKFRFTVSAPCLVKYRILVKKVEAKRLKLGTKDTLIGSVAAIAPVAGTYPGTLTIAKKYRAKLRTAKRVVGFVVVSCQAADGSTDTASRRVVLKR